MEIIAKSIENDRYELYTLCSGSTGNSVFVKLGSSAFLIDAGISARGICQSLASIGHSMDEIKSIFVTHEHSDHVKGVEQLTKKFGTPIHCISACAPYIKCSGGCMFMHPTHHRLSNGDVEIRSFATPHDSMGSVGYVIISDEVRIGIATDLGEMTDEILTALSSCDHVILESNHDVSMLENGPYPLWLRQRVLSRYGHLSNEGCAETAVTLAKNGVKSITLAHLSAENNTPPLAFATTRRSLDIAGFDGFCLKVASAHECTKIL